MLRWCSEAASSFFLRPCNGSDDRKRLSRPISGASNFLLLAVLSYTPDRSRSSGSRKAGSFSMRRTCRPYVV